MAKSTILFTNGYLFIFQRVTCYSLFSAEKYRQLCVLLRADRVLFVKNMLIELMVKKQNIDLKAILVTPCKIFLFNFLERFLGNMFHFDYE